MIVDKPGLCISIYRDVFEPSKFISQLEQNINENFGEDLSWNTSLVGNGRIGQHRTSLSCMLTTLLPPYPLTPLSSLFREQIYNPFSEVVNDYVQEHQLPNAGHELISVLKYSGLAEYHAHYDHSPDSRRIFSAVACLGAPEEGGVLEFPNLDVKIIPESGSVIFFPSNFPYVHIAHPVTSGIKYSMVTWFQ
jgi:hypothetical protein